MKSMKEYVKFHEVVHELLILTQGNVEEAENLVNAFLEKGKTIDEVQELVRDTIANLIWELGEIELGIKDEDFSPEIIGSCSNCDADVELKNPIVVNGSRVVICRNCDSWVYID